MIEHIPTVTVEQMREVDRLMVEEIGISILMMMENASRNIAVLARKMLGGSIQGKKIVILCGKGNNGGDGLGASRHLINFGADCRVFLSTTALNLGSNAKVQYDILLKLKAEINEYDAFSKKQLESELLSTDLIIDALLGYNLVGAPKEPIAKFIKLVNNAKKPVLAIDIPSGLNGNTGEAYDPAVKAVTTITLALPKAGLTKDVARDYVGELYLADLSVPRIVYKKLGINIPNIFEHEEVITYF